MRNFRAGRELDAEVADIAMGLPVVWSSPPYVAHGVSQREGRFPYLKGKVGDCTYDWAEAPRYSTSISDAWSILTSLPWQWAINYDPGGWGEVEVFVPDSSDDGKRYRHKFNHPGETPIAICAAVLKAINAGHKVR